MKIILLCGAGEVSKRGELLKIKKSFGAYASSSINLKQDNFSELERQLPASSLFSEGPRLLILENVSDKLDLGKIKFPTDDLTLVILPSSFKSDQPLYQSAKKLKSTIFNFEGEKETPVFPFLDSLLEKKQDALAKAEELLSQYGTIYLLTMIYYGLRRNLLPLPANDFMQKKILKQKQKYSLRSWEKLYYLTLKTEFAIKSGAGEEKMALSSLIYKFIYFCK